MHVSRLSLVDFRNYRGVDVALQPGVSVFVGRNGHGKTNLVEALGYLATQSSNRVAADAPLVRAGATQAVIRADLIDELTGRKLTVELEINPGGANRARLNRGPLPRASDLFGTVRTVQFAPEDLAIVKGDPAERRRFLDDLLVLRTPRLAGVRQDCDRIVRQRNTLLKSAAARRNRGWDAGADRRGTLPESEGAAVAHPVKPADDRGPLATLDIWNAHLARAGAELLAARIDLVCALRPLVAAAYDAVAGEAAPEAAADAAPEAAPEAAAAAAAAASADAAGAASRQQTTALIGYRSSVPAADEFAGQPTGQPAGNVAGGLGVPFAPAAPDRARLADSLLAELASRRRAELDRGVTLVGPHRDDLVLGLRDLPARGYASHGESWSLALALRLASYELMRADGRNGGEPVLILDDVFAELDTARRERLAALVGPAHQVLVTAAVLEDVPTSWQSCRYEVVDGSVRLA